MKEKYMLGVSTLDSGAIYIIVLLYECTGAAYTGMEHGAVINIVILLTVDTHIVYVKEDMKDG